MSISLTPNIPAARPRARVLGLVAVAGFAMVALACGVETGAASNQAVTAPPTSSEALEERPYSPDGDNAALSADISNPPAVPETPEIDELPETLMLSPELTDFTLPSGLGDEVTLSSYLGEQNVMVVFYRAWW